MSDPNEDLVRRHWKVVGEPDAQGRVNLGVLTYHSRSTELAHVWRALAGFTTYRLEQAKELQEDIIQLELEIKVNSNPGTHSKPESDAYWEMKNQGWARMANRFKADLGVLVDGMKGWEVRD